MFDQEVMRWLAVRKRCPQCKTYFAFLVPAGCGEDGCMAINHEALHHMHDTHGVPQEIYREWLLQGMAA